MTVSFCVGSWQADHGSFGGAGFDFGGFGGRFRGDAPLLPTV